MDAVREFLDKEFWGLSLWVLGELLLAITAGFVLGRVVEWGLDKARASTPEVSLRRAIVGSFGPPLGWTVRVLGIWYGIEALPLDTLLTSFEARPMVRALLEASVIVLTTWLAVRVIDRLCGLWAMRAEKTEGTYDDQLVPIVRKTAKVFAVLVGGVMALESLDIGISTLLAGVGIGGAALAFASKDTVANFFGSLVIFIDRPFQVGDWVEVGAVEGTVEEVGLRVTMIRTFANSLLTVPNATFTTTAINNWSRMRKRRIKITVGLTYDSPPDKLRQAVAAIRGIIKSDDRLHQDFYLVNFYDLGPSSLDIFCYLFSRTTNWAEHMQIREEFLLKIMEAMSGLGLQFAFPTQTVHLEGMATKSQPANQPPGAPRAMLRDTPL